MAVSGTRTPAPAEGSRGNGAPWPAATRAEGWQNTVKGEDKDIVFHFSVYGSSLVTAAMRGRLYATALLALVLALLLATTSAQENHQDSAGEPVGFDADAQAARDAEAYLTPEEKSLIQIGNDLLRGNDTIPDPEDYDVDAVRTRAPVSAISYAHVPCAPDCVSERVWPDTHLQAPSSRLRVFCYKAATRSVRNFGEPS